VVSLANLEFTLNRFISGFKLEVCLFNDCRSVITWVTGKDSLARFNALSRKKVGPDMPGDSSLEVTVVCPVGGVVVVLVGPPGLGITEELALAAKLFRRPAPRFLFPLVEFDVVSYSTIIFLTFLLSRSFWIDLINCK
jgi:hypothetical protein